MKAVLEANSLANYHPDFGAWGIARQEGNSTPYVLWSSDSMSEVYAEPDANAAGGYTGTFIPREPAYWLTGFAYNFIAVAPYTGGVSGLDVAHSVDTQTRKDAITFTFDQGAKYTAGDFDFDLMGAAAATDAITTKPTTQPLTFWHLLSKINLTIQFGKDAQDNQINAVVDAIRLSPISCAVYNLSYNSQTTESTAPLVIECTPDASATKPTIAFDTNAAVATVGPIYVIPQNVETIGIEIDFTINEGTEQNPINIPYTGFNVDLIIPDKLVELKPNGQYNYTITIGSKSAITFEVDVQDWTLKEDIPEIEMK